MAASEASEGGLSIHPMEQFEVRPLFGGGDGALGLLTITNSTMWMALVLAAVSALLILGMRGRALVPTRASRSSSKGPARRHERPPRAAGGLNWAGNDRRRVSRCPAAPPET